MNERTYEPKDGNNIQTKHFMVKYKKNINSFADRLKSDLRRIYFDILAKDEVSINKNKYLGANYNVNAKQAEKIVGKVNKKYDLYINLDGVINGSFFDNLFRSVKDKIIARHTAGNIECTIKPARNFSSYPLSYAQKRMWVLYRLEPDSPFYNITQIRKLDGSIDIPAITEALKTMVFRHNSFRTNFREEKDGPAQVIKPIKNIRDIKDDILKIHNLSTHKNKETREQEQEEIINKYTKTPFKLETDPICRFALIKTAKNKHILIIVMHHIISDGWSMRIFWRELAEIYNALLKKEKPELLSLSVDYKDYAVWEQSKEVQKKLAIQEKYWLDRMKGEIPVLDLPTDNPRPPVLTYRGAVEYIIIDKKIALRLARLARETDTTMFTLFLAVFNIFLHRITGQNDIIVGTPSAGRQKYELQNICGVFLNNLCLRTEIDPNSNFTSILDKFKKTVIEAADNEQYPFESLIEKLDPERDLSRSPLFSVMFQYDETPDKTFLFEGLNIKPSAIRSETVKFDLKLRVREARDGRVFMRLEYNTDLFTADTARRYLSALRTLTDDIIKKPARKIAELEILDKEEKQKLLCDFNDTSAEYPKNKTLSRLFEEQAEKTPDNTAVQFEDNKLTYGELNAAANRLAHYLKKEGLGANDIVAVAAERNLDIAVSTLAAHKAGACCLYIDKSLPEARIRHILRDSRAKTLLLSNKARKKFGFNDKNIVSIDNPAIAKERTDNLKNTIKSDNLAYLVYTSGSTGAPKGVQLTHKNIINSVYHRKNIFNIKKSDIFALSVLTGFVAMTFKFYTPLTSGNKLVIYRTDIIKNAPELFKSINKDRVTILDVSYQNLATYLGYIEENKKNKLPLNNLRIILPVGEKLDAKTADTFLNNYKNTKIYTTYGMTEYAGIIFKNIIKYEKNKEIKKITEGTVPQNSQVYILDKNMNLLPPGVPGDVYFSGDSLSPGYHYDTGKTKMSFLSHPFIENKIIFKTGDIGKMHTGGRLEIIGRSDNQAKIRGYRVELGEIESVLRSFLGIAKCAVILKKLKPNSEILAAYYTESSPIDIASARSYIGSKLPNYMIPAYFIRLDKFPLTPNGKIDRKALPEPKEKHLAKKKYEEPKGITEEKLAGIWQEVLNVKKISRHDNFFDLGGHSLKAIRLLSRANREFKIDLPLKDIFLAPVLSEMAQTINRQKKTIPIEIKPASKKEYYPLSSAQKRMWVLYRLEPDSPFYNITQIRKLDGSIDIPAITEALKTMVFRHNSFRTNFREEKDGPAQAIKPIKNIRDIKDSILNIHDLSAHKNKKTREQEQEEIIKKYTKTPFRLEDEPLYRFALIKTAKNKHILIIAMHHIISDGWSMNIFWRELADIYNALLKKEKPELSPLPIDYKDYSVWEQSKEVRKKLAIQEKYWLDRMKGDIPVIELPIDRPRPPVQTYNGAVERILIDSKTADKLRSLALRNDTTLFTVLFAIFNVFLCRISDQENIIIGTPSTNRNHSETENLIGFFINTLPIRSDLSGDPVFTKLLRRIKAGLLDDYANKDYPYEKLIEKLNPERDMSRNPVFSAVFQHFEKSENSIKLSGLDITLGHSYNATTKFDLRCSTFARVDGKLTLRIEYNTDLFLLGTIITFLNIINTLAEGIANNPNKAISTQSIVAPKEEHRLLYELNDTTAAYPKNKTIHQIFEAQVRKIPNNTAIIFENTKLSYAELNKRANRLAYYLRNEHKIKANTPIALLLDRSSEMIIAIMAVLKAGGCYVPIDPEYSGERIKYILKDSKVRVVLTNARNKKLDISNKIIIFEVNNIASDKRYPDNNPKNINSPNDLAYIIYTSGSTGRPKGVMIEHRSAVNRLHWMQNAYPFSARDIILQKTTYTFDVSVWELMLWFFSGASVSLLAPGGEKDPGLIVEHIYKNKITILHFVPSMFSALIGSLKENRPRIKKLNSLRYIFLSGENLSVKPVNEFYSLVNKNKRKKVQLVNLYGPTEATIDVTSYDISTPINTTIHVPIGKPIQNIQTYILDKNRNPPPLNIPGELYISGVGLARGYLNDQKKTKEVFFSHPFIKGKRIYKTGDRARMHEDGNIEILGRTDSQIKIRGFRIEPGEIEDAILKYQPVKQALAVCKKDKNQESYLAGYIVPDRDKAYPLFQELKSEIISRANRYKKYTLKNDLPILHLNKNETDFMYKEIFEEEVYARNGIVINDNDTIFDVGANIGLFSVFVSERCRGAKIYSFEPLPEVSELLAANAAIYSTHNNTQIKTFEFGIADGIKEEIFTYYPNFSILSGRFANKEEEKRNIKKYIKSVMQENDEKENAAESKIIDKLLADRFKKQRIVRPVMTISEVIKRNNIKNIDLLKIDVEKSEVDALKGISEKDWRKIKQIVLEVYGKNRLSKIKSLLNKHQFKIKIERSRDMKNSSFYNVYATRDVYKAPRTPSTAMRYLTRDYFIKKIKESIFNRLPEYMVPARYILLDSFPLTPSGKLDRSALPEPEEKDLIKKKYEAPRGITEIKLSKIWRDILELKKISRIDNFFDLGGHSLSAIKLQSAINYKFKIDLQLKSIFQSQNLYDMAKLLGRQKKIKTKPIKSAKPVLYVEKT